MPSELKPCPFCGGQKITPFTGDGAEGVGKCATFCDCCNTEGPHCNTEAEAIAAWNHRPEPATPAGDDALVAELARVFCIADWGVIRPEHIGPHYTGLARAILPILHRERAAAHAAGEAKGRAVTIGGQNNRHVTSQMRRTLMALVNAMRDYMPSDGIDKDTFISRVIGALDNPAINPVIAAFERAQHERPKP